jgi:hypothetical protein
LNRDLKVRLRSFSKLVAASKHRLRQVWDLAIQGNLVEMEEATKRAIESDNQYGSSIRHIFHFPNNRFVTREYSRFAAELLAARTLSTEMVEKSRLLRRDIPVSAHTFPNSPEHTQLDRQDVVQELISLGEVYDLDADLVAESRSQSFSFCAFCPRGNSGPHRRHGVFAK